MTRFVILMHPKEYNKEKIGTGRMTQLQLDNSEIIVGVDFTDDSRVNEILAQKDRRSFLLYPGDSSLNLSTCESSELSSFMGARANIFLLDGTWPCARKMLTQSKNLHELKRLSFDNTLKSKFLIKQQPASLCLSTIESVYTVLNLLNDGGVEQCDTSDFLVPFEKMIEHQLEYIRDTKSKHYRSTACSEIIDKNIF